MLDTNQQTTLLEVARTSIEYGLGHHQALPVEVKDYSGELVELRASFVTLNLENRLRGCIGTLVAISPLIKDVADNACSAAFNDPRFSHLKRSELSGLQVHISVLAHPQVMTVADETDLLMQLQPGIDGLVLHEGAQRATFLPSVWQSLPDAKEFLQQLKIKAGLPAGYWSESMHFERYHVQEFS